MPRYSTSLGDKTAARMASFQRAGLLCESDGGAIAELVRRGLATLDAAYPPQMCCESDADLHQPAISLNSLNLSNNNINTKIASDDAEVMQMCITSDADLHQPARRKRGKVAKFEPIDLAQLEHDMPMDCRAAWYAFKSMARAKRKRGILDTTLAALWQSIQHACAGMSDAAIAHGMLKATQAKGGGADNANYVAKAAAGYATEYAPMQQPAPPNPRDTFLEKRRFILWQLDHGNGLTAEQRQWAIDNNIALESPSQQAADASRARQMAAVNNGGVEC